MWSWGLNSPLAIKDGLQFKVEGFKFKGIVQIKYNSGSDFFDIYFIKRSKVIDYIKGIDLTSLVNVIDDKIEKVDNYNKRVEEEYYVI
jgi:hypothetical protein